MQGMSLTLMFFAMICTGLAFAAAIQRAPVVSLIFALIAWGLVFKLLGV